MLTDTHAHLYWDDYQDDLDEVIERSLDAGVTTIINVGVDVGKSGVAAKLETDKVKFYSTIGIHPHESVKYSSESNVSIQKDIEKLKQIYQTNAGKIVAVGECGLDYYLDRNDIYPDITLPLDQIKQLQRQLFQAQIDLAKKLNLPLIVHCRDDRSQNPTNTEAWDEVSDMISTHHGILHCYSGLESTTKKVLSSRFLVSFAGNITYPKNDYLKEAVKIIPLEKIAIETDCPFLPPQAKRGQRNEPAYIKETAQMIADLKGLSLEEVAHQTTANVKQILRLRK